MNILPQGKKSKTFREVKLDLQEKERMKRRKSERVRFIYISFFVNTNKIESQNFLDHRFSKTLLLIEARFFKL